MRRTFVLAAVAAGLGALALGPSASAEKPPSSPAQLERMATHVVVGEVKTIYSRVTTSAHWRQRKFVAEVAVEAVEKGDGLAKGALVYVRYWDQEWLGRPSEMPAGTNGHNCDPKEGDRFRIYLARNAYDGFGDTRDGGFNVIGVNGFAPAPPTVPAAGNAPAPTPTPAR